MKNMKKLPNLNRNDIWQQQEYDYCIIAVDNRYPRPRRESIEKVLVEENLEREYSAVIKKPVSIKTIKILFLGANPTDTTRLRLGEEVRTIDQELHQSKFRSLFDIRQHWAVRISDLQKCLLRHQPEIVHFSGHGSKLNEIILEDEYGNSCPISIQTLSRLFSLLKDNIRCVVLNACFSEQQAVAIAKSIDSVVGMSKAIKNSDAINFSKAFYRALGYGRSVKTAFDLACLEIQMKLGEKDTPRLLALNMDPSKIVFVQEFPAAALNGHMGQYFSLEEKKILEVALIRGYFEDPRRITIEELADYFGMDRGDLKRTLNSINRLALNLFLIELSVKRQVIK
jgi:hypothetical protein